MKLLILIIISMILSGCGSRMTLAEMQMFHDEVLSKCADVETIYRFRRGAIGDFVIVECTGILIKSDK